MQTTMITDYTRKKLLSIIDLSETVLAISDLEIEAEYQSETIGKYGLDFNGKYFSLTTKQTDCLVKDKCENSIGRERSQSIDYS
jgi:hypothetical protein